MIEDIVRDVYAELGPGFSERMYHEAVQVCLRMQGISYESERIIPVVFRGHTIGNVRADLIIGGDTIIEFKAIKSLKEEDTLQVLNYMKLTGFKQSYLVNFPPCPNKPCEIKFVLLE